MSRFARTQIGRLALRTTLACAAASMLVPSVPRAQTSQIPSVLAADPIAKEIAAASDVGIDSADTLEALDDLIHTFSAAGIGEKSEDIEIDGMLVADAKGKRGVAQSGGKKKMDSNLSRAMKWAQSGQYQDASMLLYKMSRHPQYADQSAQIKYILGLMLFEMKLNQSSAFIFYDVIRQEGRSNSKSQYVRKSLRKLALAADILGSDVLLRYAIKQVNDQDFPTGNQDMLNFRVGEIKMQDKNYQAAVQDFMKVRPNSIFFARARYRLGLAFAESGELEKAKAAFDDLVEHSAKYGITDSNRVNAQMGVARVLYQKQDFEGALDAYREIPRDTEQWHDALFESSWAMLRDGRFRSALSNFHSLHSAFYDDVYQPESLFLRAITYLYICRYGEMNKVMNLFERIYRPVQRDIKTLLTTVNEPQTYYRDLAKVKQNYDTLKLQDPEKRKGFQIPFIVARQILKEGDVARTFHYIKQLEEEQKRINQLPSNWVMSGIGQYSKKILEKRLEATQILAGKQIKRHLGIVYNELRDLFEQTGFLRYEMLSGKKESVRKEIAGKGLEKNRADEDTSRAFYIQNGFEYWPFKGEYWLDEIGNYHYVGVKACE